MREKDYGEDIGEFRSLVILPTNKVNEELKEYRLMDFVAVDFEHFPICRLSGHSDALHIDGIGGFGAWKGFIPDKVEKKCWTIDCLSKSGLIHIFCNCKLKAPKSFTSFEVYGGRFL